MNKIFEAEIPVKYQVKESLFISAQNQEDAKEKLEKMGITNSVLKDKSKSAISGIVAMSIAVILSFFRYFGKGSTDYIELFPNIISFTLSVIIYSAFVIRVKGLKNTFENKIDFAISFLFMLIIGIFIKLFSGDATKTSGLIGAILQFFHLDNGYPLFILLLCLSWLGMKPLCGFVLIGIMIFGLIELVTCGNYMGNLISVLFIFSAFCGCVFYLKYEGNRIIQSFSDFGTKTAGWMNDNIKASKDLIDKEINNEK